MQTPASLDATVAGVIEEAYRCQDGADSKRAIDLLTAALLDAPANADVHYALGNVLQKNGHADSAADHYRAAIDHRPDFAKAHNNLGIVMLKREAYRQAEQQFRRAFALDPALGEAAYNLGWALQAQGRIEEAVGMLQQSIRLQPGFPGGYVNLGMALFELGRTEAAIDAYRTAIKVDPGCAEGYNGLGLALSELTRLDAATEAYDTAERLAPYDALLKVNHAITLMMRGDYRRAWEKFESRWHSSDGMRRSYRYDAALEWRGGPLKGKRLLVWCEQGLGDSILFARYLPLLEERFGPASVQFECQPGLGRLFRHSLPHRIAVTEQGTAIGAFDCHVPLMSLVHRFGTTLADVPATVPYLCPTAESASKWRHRVEETTGLRVGIVWASGSWPGAPPKEYLTKSIPANVFSDLLLLPGISFISLQKGAHAANATAFPQTSRFFDWTPEIRDFDDTAALIAALDLVVSVDTAVAHLAGALCKPVYVLLKFSGGNLWLNGRNDSPWYPTLRIFRQDAPNDWSSAIRKAAREIEAGGIPTR